MIHGIVLSAEILKPLESVNKKGNPISVDHIDLITGVISGIISPLNSEEYANPKASSTRMHSRFSSDSWVEENGWCIIQCLVDIDQPTYFRLRGTNLAVNTPGEVDEKGNPLMDPPPGSHSERLAWNDTWFYSNSIFIYPQQ
ncbi:MAG: hypothetical protein PVI26_01595 [Chitinispirillia bacterium]